MVNLKGAKEWSFTERAQATRTIDELREAVWWLLDEGLVELTPTRVLRTTIHATA